MQTFQAPKASMAASLTSVLSKASASLKPPFAMCLTSYKVGNSEIAYTSPHSDMNDADAKLLGNANSWKSTKHSG